MSTGGATCSGGAFEHPVLAGGIDFVMQLTQLCSQLGSEGQMPPGSTLHVTLLSVWLHVPIDNL